MNGLKGDKVMLRAVEPADLDLIFEWENNTAIWKMSNTLAPYSRYVLEQYLSTANHDIHTSKQLRLMINTTEGTCVGCIDLFDYDPFHQRAGVGILIAAPEDRKKGYAQDALAVLKKYCFETLLLRQLYCNINRDNTDSLSLFQKQGFEHTGTKFSWSRSADGWTDEFFLQCIPS